MNAPASPIAADTRERFLAAIAQVVPAARIAEIHFFPPIRQGPVETGVAVVGAEPESESKGEDVAPEAEVVAEAEPARAPRHIVFMARYRLTRKGPDRGKWESEIIAEADAPLVTVEAVAEGVRKRSHDESAAERIDGHEARAILAAAEARRCQTTP